MNCDRRVDKVAVVPEVAGRPPHDTGVLDVHCIRDHGGGGIGHCRGGGQYCHAVGDAEREAAAAPAAGGHTAAKSRAVGLRTQTAGLS